MTGVPARCFLGVLLLLAGAPAAQSQSGTPCTAPGHREFDFWIGEWEVRLPDGTLAGTNVIRSTLGGCVLEESWASARGSRGRSLNGWDAARGVWHQTWMDDQGSVLLLEGKREGARMVLAGPAPGPDGATVLNRIIWEPMASGVVRQLWEVSPDDGTTWSTVFDGRYSRRP